MTRCIYVCRENTTCKKSYTHYNRLIQHYVTCHPTAQLPTFEEFHPELSFEYSCGACSIAFSDFASALRHRQKSHPATSLPPSEEFSLPFLADYFPPQTPPLGQTPLKENSAVLNNTKTPGDRKSPRTNRRSVDSMKSNARCRSSPRSFPSSPL